MFIRIFSKKEIETLQVATVVKGGDKEICNLDPSEKRRNQSDLS